MKLIRFIRPDSPTPCFGVVVLDQAVPFAVLQSRAGKAPAHLADSRSYLANLPDSERTAREVFAWASSISENSVMAKGSLSTQSACWSRWRSPPCSISA
jgi:hypothetical protein